MDASPEGLWVAKEADKWHEKFAGKLTILLDLHPRAVLLFFGVCAGGIVLYCANT